MAGPERRFWLVLGPGFQRAKAPKCGALALVFLPLSRETHGMGGQSNNWSPKGWISVSRLKWAHATATISVLVGVISCGGDGGPTSPPTPSAITLVSGSNQSGTVGQPLAQPLVVKVTTANGAGAPGATVSLTAVAGSGSLSAASVRTDAKGQASVSWTIGPRAGTNVDTAMATASGLTGSPVTFVASGTAGVAA